MNWPRTLVIAALLFSTTANAEIAVRNGAKVAFLGDSITEQGSKDSLGYVRLVTLGLKANGVSITPIPAGVSGDQSAKMLARVDGVLAQKPHWLVLSCGVNDVFLADKGGVPLDQFRENIAAILDRAKAAGAQMMVLTATPLGTAEGNLILASYNDALLEVGKSKGALVADVNARLAASTKPVLLDGLHPNHDGHLAMATTVLHSFGLNAAQMTKARESWLAIRDAVIVKLEYKSLGQRTLTGKLGVTLHEWELLERRAKDEKTTPTALVNAIYGEEIKKILKPAGEFENVNAIWTAKREQMVQVQLVAAVRQRITALLGKTG